MKKTVFIMTIMVLASQLPILAQEKIVEQSDHVQYGVRLYRGSLPVGVDYKVIGPVEFEQGRGTHKQGMDMLLATARLKGANAVLNARNKKDKYIGEAVYINTFPDVYSEEDFKNFKGQKECESSRTFDFPMRDVFNVIKISLDQELEEFSQLDMQKGIIETKPIEVPNGMTDGLLPGPYPVRKIVITLIPLDANRTEVNTKYEYLKGKPWSRLFLQNSNNKFFDSIQAKLETDGKGKYKFKPLESLNINEGAKSMAGKSCTVHARLILDKKLAKQYVGFDPLRVQMVPIYCKVNAEEPIVISLDGITLQDANDNVYTAGKLFDVIEKIEKKTSASNAGNYAMLGVGGMIGGMAGEAIGGAGPIDQSFMAIVKYELQKRCFKSCQINKGETEEGALIFSVPKEVIETASNYNLILTVRSLDNVDIEKINILIN
ncbi:MAG: hypothetical protein PHI59_00590 [Candidatus Omnitrophica bacterium]|nr:hypothetical protein [Candidatus Omnitrophota bacterium]